MATVTGRCGDLASGGLTPDQVATARQLLDRCRQAEGQLRSEVADEMNKANTGTSRRAHAAYER
jgi:hypothetical protein